MSLWDKLSIGRNLLADYPGSDNQETKSARHVHTQGHSAYGMSLPGLPPRPSQAYFSQKTNPRSSINPSSDQTFSACHIMFVPCPTALPPVQHTPFRETHAPDSDQDTSTINNLLSNFDHACFADSMPPCSTASSNWSNDFSSSAMSRCSNRIASNEASPAGRRVPMELLDAEHMAASQSPSTQCTEPFPVPLPLGISYESVQLSLVDADLESGDANERSITSSSGESSSVWSSSFLSSASSRTSTRSPVFECSVAAQPKVNVKVRTDSRHKKCFTDLSIDGVHGVSQDGTFVPTPLKNHRHRVSARTPKSDVAPVQDATFQRICLEDVTIGPIIGSGRTGTVWSALVNVTGQQVACKHIPSQFVHCAEAELTTLEHLPRHPSIIAYLGHTSIGADGEEIAGKFWKSGLVIIMEYMPCQSLRSTLDQFGAFDNDQIRSITRNICNGLCVLHEEGICHRDLKSLNVLLGRDGEAKLSDFGTAKTACSSGPDEFGAIKFEDLKRQDSAISVASMAGTVLWMAPEVIRGAGYHRAPDIWALGCVVYEMAFNEYPWESLHFDNEFAALAVIGFEDVSPLQGCHRELVDPLLWEFLEVCFQRDPQMRPSAAELLETPFLQSANASFMSGMSFPERMPSFVTGGAARDPSDSTRPTEQLFSGRFDDGQADEDLPLVRYDSSQPHGGLPFRHNSAEVVRGTCQTPISIRHSRFSMLLRKSKRLRIGFECTNKMNHDADLRTNHPEPCCCIA